MATVEKPAWSDETGRSTDFARIYLIVAGIFLVAIGVLGFMINSAFPIGAAETQEQGSGLVLGVFETNGWHNLAGLVFGVLALIMSTQPRLAVAGALAVGVPNALAAIAFVIEDPTTFWFASNDADTVLHALLGIGGIAAALSSKRSPA